MRLLEALVTFFVSGLGELSEPLGRVAYWLGLVFVAAGLGALLWTLL